MIVIIQKRIIALTVLCCVAVSGISFVLWQGRVISTFSPRDGIPITVVVDAGHGGEDGGAVARDGTVESQLNLEIAQKLNDVLGFMGKTTCMTRISDISIHSDGAGTLHQKKVSDLKNRVELVNGIQRAILVSVHQNSLPSSTATHGAQVFWNTAAGGKFLAESVQTQLNLAVNVENKKVAKKIPSTIYLTKNVKAPAIIVECGFLSNAEETVRLQQQPYQRILAVSIAAGICAAGEEVS